MLDVHHPSGDYHRAYYDMKTFFFKHNFIHKQGSGYVSKEKLNSQDVFLLIDDLCSEFPWIIECVEEFDVTNVGTQYGLVEGIRAAKENLDIDF